MYLEQMFEKLILTMENLDATMKIMIADQTSIQYELALSDASLAAHGIGPEDITPKPTQIANGPENITPKPTQIYNGSTQVPTKKTKSPKKAKKEDASTVTIESLNKLALKAIVICGDGGTAVENYVKANYGSHFIEEVDVKHWDKISSELTDGAWKDKLGALQPETPAQDKVLEKKEGPEEEYPTVKDLNSAYSKAKTKYGKYINGKVKLLLMSYGAENFKTVKESDRSIIIHRMMNGDWVSTVGKFDKKGEVTTKTEELTEQDVKDACLVACKRLGKSGKVKVKAVLEGYGATLATHIKGDDRQEVIEKLKSL